MASQMFSELIAVFAEICFAQYAEVRLAVLQLMVGQKFDICKDCTANRANILIGIFAIA